MNRFKNPLIILLFLIVAITVAISIDYTDTYVADRFHRALSARQYEVGTPVSLDAFIEYYDWDKVCVILPDKPVPELSTRLGLAYTPKADTDSEWSLIFIKANYVVAEIPIKLTTLETPLKMEKDVLDRWSTIVTFVHDGKAMRMEFVGNE